MGGGAAMRTAAKFAGISSFKSAVRHNGGGVFDAPATVATARTAARPVSATVCDGGVRIESPVQLPAWELDDWELDCLENDQQQEQDELNIVSDRNGDVVNKFPRVVFGDVPTIDESLEATSELNHALQKDYIPYGGAPQTEFQRFIRSTKDAMMGSGTKLSTILYDHRPLQLNVDDYRRVCRVSKEKGASFRNFPGVIVMPDNKVKLDTNLKRELLSSGKPLVPDYAIIFVRGTSSKPFARLWLNTMRSESKLFCSEQVVNYWAEKGVSGHTVFKFRMKRIDGQPELTTTQVQFIRGKVPDSIADLRGVVCKDISGGQESILIPATNLVDDPPVPPTGFTYTKSIQVSSNVKIPAPPKGCSCRGNCVDPRICACAKRNGSELQGLSLITKPSVIPSKTGS